MSNITRLRKGLNIKLKGNADYILEQADMAKSYAIKPTDFPGLTPKLKVKEGHSVKAGTSLFFDKYKPEVQFCSPVSGKVVAIRRGERRRILEVVVEADGANTYEEFSKADPASLSADQIKESLLSAGLWPCLIQRPYGVIANPSELPDNIFISGFDTNPLAPDYDFILSGQTKTLQTGIDALAKLTKGKVYLGLPAEGASKSFQGLKNVEVNTFAGPHPAGNVGIQIHHTKPINKGDLVWTITPQEILYIGRLFETGRLDLSKIVALTGSEVQQPKYYKTIGGANIETIVKNKTKKEGTERIISGNVLTGTKIDEDSFLGFYSSQVTVIPEGDEYEFMGWALPGFDKFSASRTFFGSLFPKKEYTLNANLHGGKRAFVLTEQYEKLLPMDILPVFLLKAILANDIDKMEQLGIYEVIEEDLALCEYACTSKIEVQDILRQGINTMIKELS